MMGISEKEWTDDKYYWHFQAGDYGVDEYSCSVTSTEYSFYGKHGDMNHADVVRRLATLEAENTRLKERLRWVPVSERLPEHENQVWICRKDAHGDIVFENNKWDMRQEKWKYYTINVLGWQEIEPFNLKGDE